MTNRRAVGRTHKMRKYKKYTTMRRRWRENPTTTKSRQASPSSRRECILASETQGATLTINKHKNEQLNKQRNILDHDQTHTLVVDVRDDVERWRRQRERVREMTLRAWRGYEAHAWGRNELSPASKSAQSGVFGAQLGLTIIDSLSTLHVMGLEEEFQKARQWVAEVRFLGEKKICLIANK